MLLLLLHIAEQRIGRHGFGHQVGGAQQLAQGLGRIQLGIKQKIARVEDADDIVNVVVIYRKAAQPAFPDGAENLFPAFIHMQGHHIHAVYHYIGRCGVVEFKDVFNHGAFILLDGAVFTADVHHHADFLFGYFLGGIVGVDSQKPQYTVGGNGQQPHQGQEEFRHAPDDRAGDAGDTLWIFQGDALGHQFSQHDHEIAQNECDQYHTYSMQNSRGEQGKARPRQRACKYRCKVIRCKGAGQKTAECDAYLNGRQKPRGRFDHVQHESGAFIAILSLFTDFVFIEGYHRRFGGGEERIDQDQQKL